MTLDDISKQLNRGGGLDIEVHAVELALYVPYLFTDEQRLPLTDKRGKPLYYPSRYAALRALKHTGLKTVDVVHVSAYDEMIGMPTAASSNEMRERVDVALVGDG